MSEKEDNGHAEKSLSLEDIKKLPPEKRIIALKKFEEEKEKERRNALEEEELALDDLEKEERDKEEEEKQVRNEERKAREREKSLESKVADEIVPTKEKNGKDDEQGVTYGSHEKQLKDFYAVTSAVKEKIPGVLERLASGAGTREDERFIDSYKKAMDAVKSETAYVSQHAREQFYNVQEQLQGAEHYSTYSYAQLREE